MYNAIKCGDNRVTKLLADVSVSCQGIMGQNYEFARQRQRPVTHDGNIRALLLKELTECLEGSFSLDNFTKDDVYDLIYYISTF